MEFKEFKVKELTNLVTDYVANGSFKSLKENVTTTEDVDYAILIRLADYNNNFKGPFKYVDKKSYDFLNKTKLFGGEIIISNVGANAGMVFKVPYLSTNMTLGPNSILVDFKGENNYFYYYFKSLAGKFKLNSIMSGSAQPKFNKTDFKNLVIKVPEIKIQKRVAKTLSIIDKKIDFNKKIIANLEELSQTLFKHWFVDFEFPDENGNPYKSSGGEMKESELGEIPNVISSGKLSDVAEIIMGQSPKSDTYNSEKIGMPLLNGASDFKHRNLNPNKYTSDPKKVGKTGDFVFGVRATVGLVTELDKEYAIGRGSAIARVKQEYKEWIFEILNEAFSYFERSIVGSVYINISSKDLKNYKIIKPPKELVEVYHQKMVSIFTLKTELKNQIISLTNLRDTLLPKLMSGEIEIPDDVEVDEDEL